MNRQIKKWMIIAGIATGVPAIGATASAAPNAETTETNTPTGQTRSQLIHTTAKVTAINQPNRMVTLSKDNGEEMTVTVPSDVKAFDKLKVGDKIDIDYYESMAISMLPSGAKPSMSEKKGRSVDMGGGVTGREVTVAATVVAVDPSANTVTFKGPKGHIKTVHVMDAALQHKLPSLKPGQVVQFDFTEATAAAIRPANQ